MSVPDGLTIPLATEILILVRRHAISIVVVSYALHCKADGGAAKPVALPHGGRLVPGNNKEQ